MGKNLNISLKKVKYADGNKHMKRYSAASFTGVIHSETPSPAWLNYKHLFKNWQYLAKICPYFMITSGYIPKRREAYVTKRCVRKLTATVVMT